MKVKVFICTLAFLHIKEEILMKRKNYKNIITQKEEKSICLNIQNILNFHKKSVLP